MMALGVAAVLAAAGDLRAQACSSRALRTIDEAQSELATGSVERGKQLLETAGRECGDSRTVDLRIAESYKLLGDALKADNWAQKAVMLAGDNGIRSAGEAAAKSAVPAKSLVREKYALVVGLNEFEHPSVNPLKYSAKDAEDFAAALRDPAIGRFQPQNVKVIVNSEATSGRIRSELDHIARIAMEDDLVVLYFSTHGSKPSMDGSKAAAAYLVTYETKPSELYSTAYGMDELAHYIKEKLRAKRVVTFLDTCFSGDTGRFMGESKGLVDDSLPTESIERVAQGQGSAVITSSSGQELSWESDERQNSFFTLALLDSLRRRQGLGNLRQLFTDVQRSLTANVRSYTQAKHLGKDGSGFDQNPAIFPMTGIPDIVIGTAGSEDR